MRTVLKLIARLRISICGKQHVRNIVLSGVAADINMLLPAQSGVVYGFSWAAFPPIHSDCTHPATNPPLHGGAIQGYRHNDT
jgi:hypothetical protein